MGFWNHRAIRHDNVSLEEDEEDYIICIHEVYYDDDGEIYAWTENAIAPMGETPEEIIIELDRMHRCVADKPILSMTDLLEQVKRKK